MRFKDISDVLLNSTFLIIQEFKFIVSENIRTAPKQNQTHFTESPKDIFLTWELTGVKGEAPQP